MGAAHNTGELSWLVSETPRMSAAVVWRAGAVLGRAAMSTRVVMPTEAGTVATAITAKLSDQFSPVHLEVPAPAPA